ncbi:DNA repair protein RecO [Candidatus Azambacteria bacterium]|nr:DNA repair protein RecO [Candidatus Azambacteria bacterium]MBI3685425.1 DNA repair protein RecO [Candidatus Azambacteria bacterium]
MRASTGLIIKRQNKGEHDQFLTLYTKKYGKIELVARGIRRSDAKLAGHTGLFYLSEVAFVLGVRHKVLTSAREIEHFSTLKKDTEKMQAARHVARLIDVFTLFEEKDEDIFHLVVGAFDYLNRKELKPLELKFFLRYFEFKFLSALGYEPEDKTIVRTFDSQRVVLSEGDLDKMADAFERHFANIYSKV